MTAQGEIADDSIKQVQGNAAASAAELHAWFCGPQSQVGLLSVHARKQGKQAGQGPSNVLMTWLSSRCCLWQDEEDEDGEELADAFGPDAEAQAAGNKVWCSLQLREQPCDNALLPGDQTAGIGSYQDQGS